MLTKIFLSVLVFAAFCRGLAAGVSDYGSVTFR